MKSLLLILVSVALMECNPLLSEEDECPAAEDIHPCECSHYGTESFFNCQAEEDDTSIEALKKILKNIADAPSMDLRLFDYKLGNVPSKLFEGLDIRDLFLGYNEIHSFESKDGSPVFSGLEDTLTELYVYSSIKDPYIHNFTWKLDHLHKLKTLKFNGNHDTRPDNREYWKVGNDWFENGPASLNILNLESNGIKSLGDKAFASLTNLEELSASGNNIEVVQRSMFSDPANKLTHIDFAYNQIKTLPEDFFSNMPSLEIVTLRFNQLETLDQNVWKPVWEQLVELHLGDNVICDSSINWVYAVKRPSKLEAQCSEDQGDSDKRGKSLANIIDEKTR